MKKFVVWTFCLVASFLGAVQLGAQVNVPTWHNDNWRTGHNTNEPYLTTGINKNTFGLLCKISLPSTPQQEQVYTQPLVVANNDGSMAVYVATMQDYVYAFSVPAPGTIWTQAICDQVKNSVRKSQQLVNGGEFPADACLIGNGTAYDRCDDPRQPRAICPSVGILGTPAIDTTSHTLFLVTESQDANTQPEGVSCMSKQGLHPNFYHRLHALDLTTLAEKTNSPALINPPGGKNGFKSRQLLQRPGLLFLGPGITPTSPTVYMAFSMMDGTRPNPSGWVLAYDGGNLGLGGFPLVFDTTPNVSKDSPAGGGIWQGGGGLAAGLDANQNNFIYFSTGDGVFDANNSGANYGDSFVKLTTDLQVSDYFTPADAFYRWDLSCTTGGNDFDFGSAGVVAIPSDAHMNFAYQNVAIKADKENYLWVMDRTHPGQSNACVPNSCNCAHADSNIQKLSVSSNHTAEPQSRSTPAFWDDGTTPFLYFTPAGMPLSKYPLTGAPPNGPIASPTATSPADPPDNMGYAATPSVSSNGNQNGTGIVWAFVAKSSQLDAFDAETLARLYRSTDCTRDAIGTPAKFSVPTVANGYVFVATLTDFDIFDATTALCN